MTFLREIPPTCSTIRLPLVARMERRTLSRHVLQLAARSISVAEHLGDIPIRVLDEALSAMTEDGCFIEYCPISQARAGVRWQKSLLIYTPFVYDRYFLTLEGGFESYWRALSCGKKKAVKRKVKRFEKEAGHEMHWRCYCSGGEMPEFFEIAKEILRNREGWSPRSLPDSEDFRKKARDISDAGGLRAYVLYFQQQPVSFLFCPIQAGSLVYDHLAYHREFSHLSPGFLLLWCAIRDAFAHDYCDFVDFTQGSGQQKRFFANGHMRCGDAYFLRLSLGNITAVVTHHLMSRFAYMIERRGVSF